MVTLSTKKYIYKAKDIENDLWHIGYYAYDVQNNIHYILVNEIDIKSSGRNYVLKLYQVKEDTICRFTGLTDCLGKDYYEHDIIELPDEDSDCGIAYIYEIIYSDEDCMWYLSEISSAESLALGEFNTNEFYYIGNIFDNPELLKVGENNGKEN